MSLRSVAVAGLFPAGAIAAPLPPFKVPPAWTRPTAPFHMVGPIWHVGGEGLLPT